MARADFLSKEAEEATDYVMGSLRYMAPERHEGTEKHNGDVYALGIVLANLLTGKRFPAPPRTPKEHASFLTTVLDTVRMALGSSDSDQVRAVVEQVVQLLLQMLAYEAADRPDARAVERSCRRISGRLPPPTLRDWAENSVVRLVEEHRNRPRNDEHDTGLILLERTDGFSTSQLSQTDTGHFETVASDEEATNESPAHASGRDHRFGLALLIGALIGGGIVGLAWLLSGQL